METPSILILRMSHVELIMNSRFVNAVTLGLIDVADIQSQLEILIFPRECCDEYKNDTLWKARRCKKMNLNNPYSESKNLDTM